MKVLNRLRLGIMHVLPVPRTSTTTRQQKHALQFPQVLVPFIPCLPKRNASTELTLAARRLELPQPLTAYIAQKERSARVARLQQMGKVPVHKVTGAAQEMRTILASESMHAHRAIKPTLALDLPIWLLHVHFALPATTAMVATQS